MDVAYTDFDSPLGVLLGRVLPLDAQAILAVATLGDTFVWCADQW